MGSLSPLISSLEWDPVVSITGTLAGEHAPFRRLGLRGGKVCPVRHHALRRVTLSPFGTARYGRRAWGRGTCQSAGLAVQVTPRACVLVPDWNYTGLVGSRRLGGSSRVIPPRRTQYTPSGFPSAWPLPSAWRRAAVPPGDRACRPAPLGPEVRHRCRQTSGGWPGCARRAGHPPWPTSVTPNSRHIVDTAARPGSRSRIGTVLGRPDALLSEPGRGF